MIGVGNNVAAVFDEKTKSIELHSDNGTLDDIWAFHLGSARGLAISVRVADGKVFLPKDSSYIFSSFYSLEHFDSSGFDTSNVTDMSYMFHNCENLTNLDVKSFDTSKVRNMYSMFWSCKTLTYLDLSGFDTTNVKSMRAMFGRCWNLTELNLSGFDISNIEDMYGMFYECKNLKHVTMNPVVNQYTTTSEIFKGCRTEII